MRHSPERAWVLRSVFAFLVIAGVAAFLLRPLPNPDGMDVRVVHQPEVVERPRLLTATAGFEQRALLLDSRTPVLYTVQEISERCISLFSSSFSFPQGQPPVRIPIADPGRVFQSSDALLPDAPYRRLVFAGEYPSGCFIYYQHGGVNYARFCMAIMDYSKNRAVWVGVSPAEARDVPELRRLLESGKFDAKGKPAC